MESDVASFTGVGKSLRTTALKSECIFPQRQTLSSVSGCHSFDLSRKCEWCDF